MSMSANFNFESEPFDRFTAPLVETSEEVQVVRDHRAGTRTNPVRVTSRTPARPGFVPPRFGSVHGAFGNSPARVIARTPSYGRGISDTFRRDRFPGSFNRGYANHAWYGG